MADIAKFGIEIDPREASSGADKVKRGLRDIGREAETTQNKVDRSFRKQGRGAQRMARTARGAFGDLTNGIVDLLDGIGLLNNGFGSLIRRGQNLQQAGQRMSGVFGSVATQGAAAGAGSSAAATGIGAAGGAAGAAGGAMAALLPILAAIAAAFLAIVAAVKATTFVFGQIKRGVGLAAEFEKTQVAMEVLVGSTRTANRVLEDLREFSDLTPLSPAEVQNAGRTLLAFGSDVGSVVGEIQRIGDVAQGVQAPLGEIATLYGKARVQGTLFAEDINQLTNRGIPVIQLFAEQLGVSTEQVKKMGSEGKITFENLEQAFITMTSEGGKFQGMMERTSQTFAGRVSTLSGLWDNLVKEMGEPVRDALKPLLEDLIGIVRLLTPIAVEFGTQLGNAIRILYEGISSGQLEKLLGLTLLAGFETAVDGFLKLVMATIQFAGKELGNVLGKAFGNATDFFRKALNGVIQAITDALNKVVDVYNTVTDSNVGGFINRGIPTTGAGFAPDERSFADVLDGQASIVGTNARDSAANLAADLLQRSQARTEMEELNRDPSPTREIENQLGQLTGGGGGGGSGGAAATSGQLEDTKLATQQLLEDFGNLQQQMDQFTATTLSNFASSISDAFSSIALGTKDAKTAFVDMANAIVEQIVRMIIQLTIQLALQQALGMSGGTGAIVGALGGAATAHSGGLAGSRQAGSRGVGPSTFHSGGITSSEAAIKVDRNETILTRRRSEELEMELSESRNGGSQASQGGTPVQILNVTDPAQVADAIAANPDMIVNAISRRAPAVRSMIMRGG